MHNITTNLKQRLGAMLFSLILFWGGISTSALAVENLSNPWVNKSRVVDISEVLPTSLERNLNYLIANLKTKNDIDMVVVTVENTGIDPQQLAGQLLQQRKSLVKGAALVINEDSVAIKVTADVAQFLSEDELTAIVETSLIPALEQGELSQGISVGTRQLLISLGQINDLQLRAEALKVQERAVQQAQVEAVAEPEIAMVEVVETVTIAFQEDLVEPEAEITMVEVVETIAVAPQEDLVEPEAEITMVEVVETVTIAPQEDLVEPEAEIAMVEVVETVTIAPQEDLVEAEAEITMVEVVETVTVAPQEDLVEPEAEITMVEVVETVTIASQTETSPTPSNRTIVDSSNADLQNTILELLQAQQSWTSSVVDTAQFLTPEAIAQVTQDLQTLYNRTGTVATVVTVRNTEPAQSPQQFADKLFEAWSDFEAGILILISKDDQFSTIVASESLLTEEFEEFINEIVDQTLIPLQKINQFDLGILVGMRKLVLYSTLH